MHALRVDAIMVAEQHPQPRRVQDCAGAHHAVRVEARKLSCVMCQRIYRVRGNQQDPFRVCRHDLGNHVAEDRRVLLQQVEARFAGSEAGAHRNHNHFRSCAILKTAGTHQCGVRPRFGVADVLRFALGLLAVAINQDNVGSQSRQQQRIRRSSAHIANAHYRNTVLWHLFPRLDLSIREPVSVALHRAA